MSRYLYCLRAALSSLGAHSMYTRSIRGSDCAQQEKESRFCKRRPRNYDTVWCFKSRLQFECSQKKTQLWERSICALSPTVLHCCRTTDPTNSSTKRCSSRSGLQIRDPRCKKRTCGVKRPSAKGPDATLPAQLCLHCSHWITHWF